MRRLSDEEISAYDLVDASVARRVLIQRVPRPGPVARAMTLGRLILITRDDDRRGGSELLAHELVHAAQYRRLGFWPFLRVYLTDYARNLKRLRHHGRAYLAIGLEVEAFTAAAQWAARLKPPVLGLPKFSEQKMSYSDNLCSEKPRGERAARVEGAQYS